MVTDQSTMHRAGSLGEVYVALEYADGDLQGLTRSSKFDLTVAHARFYLYQLLQGVLQMHSRGVLHRDIKPANILVTRDHEVKIADFGISKQLRAACKLQALGTMPPGKRRQLMTSGDRVQTVSYRAPEVFLGDPHYTGAIDMWSVGITMGVILAGPGILPGGMPEGKLNAAHMEWIWDLVGTDQWPGAEALPNFKQFRPARPVRNEPGGRRTPLWRKLFGKLDPAAQSLLAKMLHPDPAARITFGAACSDDFFWPVARKPDASELPRIELEAYHDAGAREAEHEARVAARERARAAAQGRLRPSLPADASESRPGAARAASRSRGPSADVDGRRSNSRSQPRQSASIAPGPSPATGPAPASPGPSAPAASPAAPAPQAQPPATSLGGRPSNGIRLEQYSQGAPANRGPASVTSQGSSRLGSVGRSSAAGSYNRGPLSTSMPRGVSEARSVSVSASASASRGPARSRGINSLAIGGRRGKRPRSRGRSAAPPSSKRPYAPGAPGGGKPAAPAPAPAQSPAALTADTGAPAAAGGSSEPGGGAAFA